MIVKNDRSGVNDNCFFLIFNHILNDLIEAENMDFIMFLLKLR